VNGDSQSILEARLVFVWRFGLQMRARALNCLACSQNPRNEETSNCEEIQRFPKHSNTHSSIPLRVNAET
jgi:hypothetical protein